MPTPDKLAEVTQVLREIHQRFAPIRDLVTEHGSKDDVVRMRQLMRLLKLTIRDLDALNRGI